MRGSALISSVVIALASPVLSEVQPCIGSDGGVSDEGPSADQLAYIAKRFELACHTRNPEKGIQPLRLFREPNLESALDDGTMVAYVDILVDQIVTARGDQFMGGSVYTPTRCPLVQRLLPDGNGGNKLVDHWYMLATDLACDLKQPGEE